MPIFAALYAAAALVMVLLRQDAWDPLPWMGVCFAAAALAAPTVRGKYLVMPSAAHAGLTATWAGTVTAAIVRRGTATSVEAMTLGMLLVLCTGMAVLIAAGLMQQPEPQRVKSSRP